MPPGNVSRPMFWHKDTVNCCPAVYLHSNPFNTNRTVKPWIDVLLPHEGLVYYNGDNKTPGLPPSGRHNSGNGVMERLWADYASHSKSIRQRATPIFVFEHAEHNGIRKGFRRFVGYGLVTKVDVKQEYDAQLDGVFSNYLFEVSLLKADNGGVDWNWIHDRRNPKLSIDKINRLAPSAWKHFVECGLTELESLRQRLYHHEASSPTQQRAELQVAHTKVLDTITKYYPDSVSKGRFEALASLVTQEFFGKLYKRGWMTQHSNDMGVDFVGRLNLQNNLAPAPTGTVLGRTSMLVLGQAKCRTHFLTAEESARDIARVAARLGKGAIGVYITTGCFKKSTQNEVALDGYPIILINGRQLSDLLLQYCNRTGQTIEQVLAECDEWFATNQRSIPPYLMLKDIY